MNICLILLSLFLSKPTSQQQLSRFIDWLTRSPIAPVPSSPEVLSLAFDRRLVESIAKGLERRFKSCIPLVSHPQREYGHPSDAVTQEVLHEALCPLGPSVPGLDEVSVGIVKPLEQEFLHQIIRLSTFSLQYSSLPAA